jgi:hypothetical protein
MDCQQVLVSVVVTLQLATVPCMQYASECHTDFRSLGFSMEITTVRSVFVNPNSKMYCILFVIEQ